MAMERTQKKSKRPAGVAAEVNSDGASSARPLEVSIKQLPRSQQAASLVDIQNTLLWLWNRQHQQQQQQQEEQDGPVAAGAPQKPPWLNIHNSRNLGSVLVVMIPYLDASLLRTYCNSSTGDLLLPPCSSIHTTTPSSATQHEQQRCFSRVRAASVLSMAAREKIRVRPPMMAVFPHCGIVQGLLFVPSTPTSFRGTPLRSGRCSAGAEDVSLSRYLLTEEEMSARGFPGYELDSVGTYFKYTSLEDAKSRAIEPRLSLLFGVDCEMVETKHGKELGRVCIVDRDLRVLIDELVQPSAPVLDYLTQYSGLTEKKMQQATLSLRDVHAMMSRLLPPGFILVGHSLEYDLRALRLVHSRCIDTSLLYPHPRVGLSFSLKRLVQVYLKREMKRVHGHDPQEDAQMALLLALKKIDNGPGFAVPNTRFAQLASVMHTRLKNNGNAAVGETPIKRKVPGNVEEGESTQGMEETEKINQEERCCCNNAFFLVDSFQHKGIAASENVSVIDGLHDDSAVVSACKELLKGRHASCSCRSDSSQATYGPSCKQQAGGGGRNKPLWGVCVLRGLQRLCSGALHTPDDQLYAFRHRARTLLAAEKALLKQQVQLQQKGTEGGGAASVASTVCSTAATVASETPNEENEDTRSQSDDHSDNKDDAAEAESCSINLEDPSIAGCIQETRRGLKRDIGVLFPTVQPKAALEATTAIDHLLADMFATMQPQDLLILLSPCGDAHRYFSLKALKSMLEENKASCAGGASVGPQVSPQLKPPFFSFLKWNSDFETELEKAKNVFEGPAKGGWCSFIVRRPERFYSQ